MRTPTTTQWRSQCDADDHGCDADARCDEPDDNDGKDDLRITTLMTRIAIGSQFATTIAYGDNVYHLWYWCHNKHYDDYQ